MVETKFPSGESFSKPFSEMQAKHFEQIFRFHWWYVVFMYPATEIKVTLDSCPDKCPKASHGRLLHGKCLQGLCIYGCSILILSLVWYIPTVLQEYDYFLNDWDLWITEQCSMLTLHDQTNHTAVMYLTEHTHTDLQYDRSSRGAPTLLHLDLNRTFASTHSTFMSISCFPGIWYSAGAPLSHMPQCPGEHAV